jgi:hypothetical protein
LSTSPYWNPSSNHFNKIKKISITYSVKEERPFYETIASKSIYDCADVTIIYPILSCLLNELQNTEKVSCDKIYHLNNLSRDAKNIICDFYGDFTKTKNPNEPCIGKLFHHKPKYIKIT